ncbi:MAG: hypothetical protein IH621_09710 [Krumholzibacteria bacterium]|nr:hypothetical protein [Candidatus Krumholzibacteria bacterium]
MQWFSTPQQFIEYARAYLVAAIEVCGRMVALESQRTWPNGSVASMLAAHSVELFLKGMILHRAQRYELKSHDIDILIADFDKLYPEESFRTEFPFKTVYLGPTSVDEPSPKNGDSTPSMLYRYPVAKNKAPWSAFCGLDPLDFMAFLEKWQKDSEALVALAAKAG